MRDVSRTKRSRIAKLLGYELPGNRTRLKVTMYDLYPFYLEHYNSHPEKLTEEQFFNYLEEYFDGCINLIVKGNAFITNRLFGNIGIFKNYINFRTDQKVESSINWGVQKATGQLVHYRNSDTKGAYFYYDWIVGTNKHALSARFKLYCFTTIGKMRSALHKQILLCRTPTSNTYDAPFKKKAR